MPDESYNFKDIQQELLVMKAGTAEGTLDFSRHALSLFEKQYPAVTPYQKFCNGLGKTPANVADWSQIPALPTDAFKLGDVTSLLPSERITWFQSSGTTGQQRSRHFHNPTSLEIYEASVSWGFARQFGHEVRNFLFLTPDLSSCPHSSLVHMFCTIGKRFGINPIFAGSSLDAETWDVDFEKAVKACSKAVENSASIFIAGTAFSFVHLVDYLKSKGLKLQLANGSLILETGGYKGRSRVISKRELYTEISSAFGINPSQIIAEYGMSELSSQAYDFESRFENRRLFKFPPWARWRIISPETGREAPEGTPGFLEIVDLANVYSVAAIRTQDLAVKVGDGFELLGRAGTAEPRGCSLRENING